MVRIEIEGLKKFERSLKKYSNATGKTVTEGLVEHAATAAGMLVKATPPKSASQGKKAVLRDVKRVYGCTAQITVFLKRHAPKLVGPFSAAVRKGDWVTAGNIASKAMSFPVEAKSTFDGGKAHKSRRDRHGRIKKGTEKTTIDNCGNTIIKYARTVGKEAGYAKSGWATAINQLKQKTFPKWISNHRQSGRGWKTPNAVYLHNKVKYISHLISESYVSNILYRSQRSSIRRMNRAMQELAKKSGL